MASLKVFISSTCYDLHSVRGQLRNVMLEFGHEPIMSDQSEVIFDPQAHTHTSCLREVKNCDVVVLVMGSRFGGTIVPKALEQIDIEKITDMSRSDRFGDGDHKISITQAEVLQAIQNGIPVFAFVDSGIMRDHLTYEKNKNKDIINQIEFSSIDKPETAAYIFEFINFLRLRNENNSIFEFSRFEDIETQLKKQWSGLFQRLLSEQRLKGTEGRNIDQLSSQIADLKAAVLGSISSGELKETAKGAIRFRSLIDFTYSLFNEIAPEKFDAMIKSNTSWKEIIADLKILDIVQPDRTSDRYVTSGAVLIREDGTYFRVRMPLPRIYRFEEEWNDFKELGDDAKTAIISAILDSSNGRPISLIKYFNEPYLLSTPNISDVTDDTLTTETPLNNYMKIRDIRKDMLEHALINFIHSDPELSKINPTIKVKSEDILIETKTENRTQKFLFRYETNQKFEELVTTLTKKIKDTLISD
ncbi:MULTISPECIES: DUF4062 domain-containing protein [Pseudomonas]|uniref:DUF4062 domain-containing protein n=1 Tax=Pseudomonas TaxID=286 RepID=UPI00049AC116|nr:MULTISPECIES: DUF4062 domain-containing protein [Pseudomonas]AIB43424.1 hypothetical protein PD374_20600 [Pseudomonas sp. WCS374]MDI3183537.1 DUF4062 domain-containing protein [Pseudomonas paracarnis]PTT08570.1 DUF4062 domain-containing protein [Pseudomonas sp. HMWF034]PVV67548.1 DUF4062 domain-containing protein [Pseudomonas sp. HMWF011]